MGKREYVRCCGRVRVHVVACVCVCVSVRASLMLESTSRRRVRGNINQHVMGKAANHGSGFQIFHRMLEDTTGLGLHTEIRRIKFLLRIVLLM